MVLRILAPLLFLACHAAPPPAVPSLDLQDTAGHTTSLPRAFADAPVTVVVFYADHCPCFRAHEERLKELAKQYPAVKFLLVDSEVSATPERDGKATERGLPPIVLDPGAKLATALAAEYATYTVVFDAAGTIRYRGGIDTDKNQIHADAEPYLKNALDDLTAGREPRRREGKALGCALQTQ